MKMLRIFEAGALTAALVLGTAAFADNTMAPGTGTTTGPADRQNVMPSTGADVHGGAGVQGLPGNKSGPAVYPNRKASAGSMKTQEPTKK